MAKVELRQVSKVYPGGIQALHEVDLEACDGEILVLLGPNGSGKTTLLRLIAGLERLSSGEIRIGGAVVNGWAPRRRQVAMIFQGSVLYPHLTVEQNMRFGMESSFRFGFGFPAGDRGRPGSSGPVGSWLAGIGNWLASQRGDRKSARAKEIRDRVHRAAQLLSLERLLDRFPRQLSGGESQRVAIGRALVRQPAVFLLDEPWSNVDTRVRQQLRDGLRSVRSQFGGPMILVTHDHREASALGDRVAVMEAGRIRQVGRPADIDWRE